MENNKQQDNGQQKNKAGVYSPTPNTQHPTPNTQHLISSLQSPISNLQSPFSNPVTIKELRSRMRGGRAFAILTTFLLILSFVSYGLYRLVGAATQFDASGLMSAVIGQTLFAGLAFFELFLILFITPALTAGTISSERENLTYEMLVATPLRPRTILWGKLLSALSYVLLLIFAAIPLTSLVFIFGGIAPGDALKALLMLVMTAITFGVVGLFFSSLTGRTARATVLSYSFLLLVSISTLFIFVAWGIIQNAEPPRAILFLNPLSGMASVLAEAMPQGRFGIGIPFSVLAGDLRTFSDGAPVPVVIRPTWHFTVALYTALSVTLYLISTQLVKPIRRWRIGWLGAAVVIVLLLLFGLGGYVLSQPLAGEAEGIGAPTPALMIAPAPPVMIERAVPIPYPPPPTPTPAAPPEETP